MGEWAVKSLADVVELRRGFDLPHRLRADGPYPVLTAGKTAGWHSEGPIKGPGFVVGRATNLGEPMWSEHDYWPLNTTLYAASFKGNVPRFLFHLFQVLDLKGFDSGSVQPMLNRNYISQVQVRVPDIDTQLAIAEVLGALDDKIAANERVLTASADLLAATYRAAIQGGDRAPISELAESIVRGKAPKYVQDEGLLVLNQKCIRAGGISLVPARLTSDKASDSTRLLRNGDVLVNSTGQGTLGRAARWIRPERATVDSHITIVRFDPTLVDVTCAGVGLACLESEIEGLAEGSTGQTELRRDLLATVVIDLPPSHIQAPLGEEIRAIDRRGFAAAEESNSLARTRDELLPLLMSGRMSVATAEREVSNAG